MRQMFLFPAAFATVVATAPGPAQATSTTCSTSTVCAEYINTYTYPSGVTTGGVAIHGEADNGIGVRGTSVTNTGFYGASGSGSRLAPGIEGESTNNTGNDAAAGFGLSYLATNVAPFLGAFAYGSRAGFFGFTASPGRSQYTQFGFGIAGEDNVGAPTPMGDFNAGVFGSSTFGTSVLAESATEPSLKYYFGQAPIGVYSVVHTVNETPNPNAYAFVGETNSYGMELANTKADSDLQAQTPAYFLLGSTSNAGVANTGFNIDYAGNEYLGGTLTTSKGGPYVRTTGSSGAAVREYTDRTTTPEVEDFGDGELRNGSAYVPIDARLADTIDRRTEYHVFVTPEGDCKGLYVTQKKPSGFVVRELQGGRSSLPFEYRIVAKPIDDNGARLAAMAPVTLPKDLAIGHVTNSSPNGAPRSIEDDLKRRLGPQAYAKAIAALRARLIGR